MTEQIKSAIAILKAEYQHHPECSIMGESLKTAIRSLQAWDEVLQELKTKQKSIHDSALDHEDDLFLGEVIGIVSTIEVINQHLEIEE